MLSNEHGQIRTISVRRCVVGIFASFIVSASLGNAEARVSPKVPASKSQTVVEWERLEAPLVALQTNSELFTRDDKGVGPLPFDVLEGMANEAVLSRIIKSVYTQAAEKKWVQTHGFQIFPMQNLLSNSAKNVPVTFNPNGFRVGILALRLGSIQRGVLLTASFQSHNPAELRELYRKEAVLPMLTASENDFRKLGAEIVTRLQSGDPRQSRHVEVAGSAEAWVVGCETVIGGRFCVNANLFDSNATDPSTFISALSGKKDIGSNVQMIRAQNLAWPIEKTHISRGYKSCACAARHYGLDLTAPVGTPVYSVASGVVLHAKQFSGWGKAVVIEHELPDGSKYISLYAHLSKFRRGLSTGDRVERGALIAATGKSGSSATGDAIPPHLHLEIRNAPEGKEPLQQPRTVADRPVDPLLVLDMFNVFVGSESLTPAAGEIIEFKTK